LCILLLIISFIFFFFFQAEDGIRDKLVTGVQTCALPISPSGRHAGVEAEGRDRAAAPRQPLRPGFQGAGRRASRAAAALPQVSRSEERRVGKECRSRW